jgi:hypothetical protein
MEDIDLKRRKIKKVVLLILNYNLILIIILTIDDDFPKHFQFGFLSWYKTVIIIIIIIIIITNVDNSYCFNW